MLPPDQRSTENRTQTRTSLQVCLVGVGLLGLGSLLLAGGCARDSEVRAESREIRLTRGDGIKIRPAFSPDGQQVAYSTKDREMGSVVYVVPARGGEARRVSEEGTAERLLAWAPDGKALYTTDVEDMVLRRIGLDGQLEKTFPNFGVAEALDISRDGKRFLYVHYSGDNFDVAMFEPGKSDHLEYLQRTPEWEVAACFGPKEGEATVCQKPTGTSQVGEICVWSPETGSYAPLPLPKAHNNEPEWSPDSRYLAYVSDKSGNRDIWIYDPESGRTIQVTSTQEEEASPRWSPDGQYLAFSRGTTSSHIFVGDPETKETRQLTDGEGWEGYPVASEDGEWLAVVSRPAVEDGKKRKIDLAVVSVATGEMTELDLGEVEYNHTTVTASFSPDASQLAFSGDDGTGNVDIYTIPRTGGVPTRITIAPGADIHPTWSPDGRTIAYTRRAGGETQIWAVPATGGLTRRLTDNPGINQGATWAPDSDHLAYYSLQDGYNWELWTTSLSDPASSRMVLPRDDLNYPMAWSEDGAEVLVWKKGEKTADGKDTYSLWAADMSGSLRMLGVECADDENRPFCNLNEAGEAYSDQIYRGGIAPYADGDTVFDIYVLKVPELIEEKLQASLWN